MSVQIPNGSIVSIAAAYAAADTVSAATNANPSVLTSTAHGISNGAFFEWTSGWSRANGRIFRASGVATNSISPEGLDTSSTTRYPAGSGTGSIREITSWTQLAQILNSSSNGGEQQFTEYQFLEADAASRIPTNKSARGLTFSVADDISLPGYVIAQTANDDRLPRAVRIVLPSGGIILYNAYISLGEPSLTTNEIMAVEVTLSLVNQSVRYAS